MVEPEDWAPSYLSSHRGTGAIERARVHVKDQIYDYATRSVRENSHGSGMKKNIEPGGRWSYFFK